MQCGAIVRIEDGKTLFSQALMTDAYWERARGLLGRAPLSDNEALLITPCNSVHMFFMGYPIDVVYLDKTYLVTQVVEGLRPWRVCWGGRAFMTLEVVAGAVARHQIEVGCQLAWQARDRA